MSTVEVSNEAERRPRRASSAHLAGTGKAESLSQTNFCRVFQEVDAKTRKLIQQAIQCSQSERRSTAEIVVEGVRLFAASESSGSAWAELIRNELTSKGIRVNSGANYGFRVVANLLFRGMTKNKDDAELADSMISNAQLSRYAQAMALAYAHYKGGTTLKELPDKIVQLGGVRKAADLWSHSQRNLEVEPDSTTAPASSAEAEDGAAAAQLDPAPSLEKTLPALGVLKLSESIQSPIVCLLYPDGRVFRAPLTVEAMADTISGWESSR